MEISDLTRVEVLVRYKPILTDRLDRMIDSRKRLKVVHLEYTELEKGK